MARRPPCRQRRRCHRVCGTASATSPYWKPAKTTLVSGAATPRAFDISAIAHAARQASPGTRVHADVSHWMCLTLGGALPNPLDAGADSFGGSTHKTFPGPQKGLIATNDPQIARLLHDAQPHVISSHHYGATCALGLALAVFTERCPGYPRTIITNARALGTRLADKGLPPKAPHSATAKDTSSGSTPKPRAARAALPVPCLSANRERW